MVRNAALADSSTSPALPGHALFPASIATPMNITSLVEMPASPMARRATRIAITTSLALATIAGFSPSTQGQERGNAKPSTEQSQSQSQKSRSQKSQPPEFRWVNSLPKKFASFVTHGTFDSKRVSQPVGYAVLLPPDYDANEKRYPVVYYLHGGRPGSEGKGVGLAPIIDKEMRAGNVPGMIYVFVNGGPVSHYNVPGQPGTIGADVFIHELIPHIDATFRTIADRTGRGIEGFSQGGRGTMRLSLRYPEYFVSAAAGGGGYETERKISENGGAERPDLVFAQGDNAWDLARAYDDQKPPVRWLIYVGTLGFNYQNNLAYMEFLKELGIEHQSLIVPGIKHSARDIYGLKARQIMNFHAKNFGR